MRHFFPSAEGLTVEGKRQLTGMWLFFAFFYSHVIWSMGSCGLPVVFMVFFFFLNIFVLVFLYSVCFGGYVEDLDLDSHP